MCNETDEQFLRQAIGQAMLGRGKVEPNPMVGCVIVKDGRVMGQGHHDQFGGPHAEPNALANCAESAEGATAFVTLEPCCHKDKKTPPCAPRLIAAKIARVVIGCFDPNPKVNGKGVKMLREAGIRVDGALLESECKQLIAPFLARVNHERAYITLKWAQTADGKVGGANGTWLQISNKVSRRIVHELRAKCDAIVVGIGTVLADDPMLTSRGVRNARPSVRYVLDRHLRIPLESRLVQTAKEFPVVIACSEESMGTAQAAMLRQLGLVLLAAAELKEVGAGIFAGGATHVLVEPGPILAQAFVDKNFADRLWVIQSETRVNDPAALSAAAIPAHFVQSGQRRLKDDILTEYLNMRSPLYFANAISADLLAVDELSG